MVRLRPSADGRSIVQVEPFPAQMQALDLITGPGGVVIGVDYNNNKLKIAFPQDQITGLTVYDIFPWRAPASGGSPFVIGGFNFGNNPEDTKVLIGGVPAQITSVGPTRIRGIIPARPAAPNELLTVSVTVAGNTVFLPAAFKYVGSTVSDTGARGFVDIDPGGSLIGSSTFNGGSFSLFNGSTSGQTIDRVTINLATAIFPDMVFDPFANAGDSVGKNFTVDFNGVGGSITPNFQSPKDGGFETLDITFNSFDPNEGMSFSVDVDPTSINGTPPPGPGESGSVSGLELTGSTVTFYFSDGSVLVTQPYRKPGSLVAAKNQAKPIAPGTPSLEALGLSVVPALVTDPNQVLRVTGDVGASVVLLHVEAAQFLQGNGFDVEPFEANTALTIDEQFGVIGPDGFVDIPVELRKSQGAGGYNIFVAAQRDETGDTGPLSGTVVLQLQ